MVSKTIMLCCRCFPSDANRFAEKSGFPNAGAGFSTRPVRSTTGCSQCAKGLHRSPWALTPGTKQSTPLLTGRPEPQTQGNSGDSFFRAALFFSGVAPNALRSAVSTSRRRFGAGHDDRLRPFFAAAPFRRQDRCRPTPSHRRGTP
jgi:hypothetical protein